ncbi:uncharacterized protein LOC108091296 [Drosophila ficusphila]|uniref:uncharacterized protein LOC108091296 n=1 Tax=Drosophila ficusphila TaxID=30025 RepID=UPI0007E821DB|nr:uncharacterized protein LOC108091296 [Drosophila ficusphila]
MQKNLQDIVPEVFEFKEEIAQVQIDMNLIWLAEIEEYVFGSDSEFEELTDISSEENDQPVVEYI